jgi:DNA polymerase III psi subunit
VLNLRAVRKFKGHLPEYATAPMFEHPALNAAIIVKHRLRRGESDQFSSPRRSATKVMVPIESDDLSLGARYVFVGQRQFKEALAESFGISIDDSSRDLRTLTVLDQTPTLDPFLLREQLRRFDLEPARCYFELSEADSARMFAFAQREIEALIRMSTDDVAAAADHAARMTRKILANSADADLEPLRLTMQLERPQFLEGVFCWKAFLYYKWQLGDILPRIAPVLNEIATVKTTLGVYDNAYQGLTQRSDPAAFRDFLLKAPALFNQLGERLGGIEHIVSFWRFRFPANQRTMVTPAELASVFMDFEGSLGAAHVEAPGVLPKPQILEAARG